MPRILANEKAGALTYQRSFSLPQTSVMPCSRSDLPRMTCVAMCAIGTPVDFERKGTVRDERGLTSMT